MLEALAIVGASARKRSDFLLGLSDNGRSSLLTLIANVLAIIRRCSQSWSPAHIICQREWRQRGTRMEPSAIPSAIFESMTAYRCRPGKQIGRAWCRVRVGEDVEILGSAGR